MNTASLNPNAYRSIQEAQQKLIKTPALDDISSKRGQNIDTGSFSKVLERVIAQPSANETLKFSKHAAGRLRERDIELSDTQISRLTDAGNKAGLKGIKDSLVLMDDLAFILNVPSKTVVTAFESSKSNEGIFTNIDGAVIA